MASKTNRAADIHALVALGFLVENQTMATIELDRLKVRGGWDREGYTGYDYDAQAWITMPAVRALAIRLAA